MKGFYCFKKTEKRKSFSVTTDLDNCQNVYENPELGLKMEVSGTTLYKVEVMSGFLQKGWGADNSTRKESPATLK